MVSALAHNAPADAGIQDHLPGYQLLDGVGTDLFVIGDCQYFPGQLVLGLACLAFIRYDAEHAVLLEIVSAVMSGYGVGA